MIPLTPPPQPISTVRPVLPAPLTPGARRSLGVGGGATVMRRWAPPAARSCGSNAAFVFQAHADQEPFRRVCALCSAASVETLRTMALSCTPGTTGGLLTCTWGAETSSAHLLVFLYETECRQHRVEGFDRAAAFVSLSNGPRRDQRGGAASVPAELSLSSLVCPTCAASAGHGAATESLMTARYRETPT